MLALELGLLVFVVRQFRIESSAFLRIVLLALVGFVVHSFLPLRYRLPFFLALSLTGIGVVFGITNGAWLVGIGLVLILICHLPLSFSVRVVLLLLTGSLLAGLRVGWLHVPWSPAVWPILGSMFMFRLIVYLYDLRHEKQPVSYATTLAYFFMLPNVCFPLFPVVDYKTFRRTYYDDQPFRIHQTGIDWMLRGVIHLILYRCVYQYFTLAPSEVMNLGDLARYLISTFFLYLRVSGQFHIIVGMLHLFGFHLPESHHRYYLASSFTDFWRRINIYWKDFMLKVFYYPVYFKVRTWGPNKAMVVSTLFVFVSTWFLHAYQWFWLRGSFLLAWQDVTFWTMLGLLVVINSVYEAKHGRERSLTRSSLSFHRFAAVSLRTVLTFSVICVLWSLWTSESVSAWISLWTVADQSPSFTAGTIPLFFVLGVVVSGTVREIAGNNSRNARQPGAAIGRSALISLACLALLCLLGVQEMHTQFGPKVATVINSLRSGKLSRVDNAMLERGYYEQLMQVDRFNSQLWEVYMNKPLNWLDVRGTGLEKFTGDFKQKELLPSFVAITSHGPIRTNRWGMRDQDYEKQPAPGTFRVALLGASSVMGWGVQDSETFESLLEERLNRENSKGPYAKYEILNFAVPGYQPLQQVMTLENAFSFQPSAVFYVAAGREAQRCSVYLAEVIRKRIYVPYEYLREIARKARIEATMGETEAVRRLEPFGAEMLAWVYRGIVQSCRERGIVPVWVFLPTPLEDPWQEDTASLLRAAEESGFIVLNLVDVYRNHDIKALRFAEWDAHPNAQGHKLIADKLYDLLWERKKDILLSFGSGQIGQGK